MRRTNIYLDDDQLRALKYLAAEEQQSVANLVREAVNDYLARHMADDSLWRDRLDALLKRIQSRMPPDVSDQEIEEDISVAREEVRQMRRAARRS